MERLYAEVTPENTENSFDMGYLESLDAKISPCLNKGDYCQRTEAETFGQNKYPSGAAYCDAIAERYQSIQERRLEQLSD